MERSFQFTRKKVDGSFVDGTKAYENAALPIYSTKHSAGADFFAAEDVVIPGIKPETPLKPTLVHTGIKAQMMEDEVLYLFNRSSGPKKGLVLANGVGVVDADYYGNPDNDGDICFAFYNVLPEDITIKAGDRIGQGVFQKFLRADAMVEDQDRTGGFGSTDR